MRRWLQILEFPLLRKELTELAVQKRTYILRVFFAFLSILICFSTFRSFFEQAEDDPVSVMGTAGPETFMLLFKTMIVMVFIFTPAVSCGAISHEKERNTIGLLLLSRLGPWAILLEKLLSRSVPVLSFVLISMPLFAVAFAFGGVDFKLLFAALGLLLVLSLSLASISIMCSSFARTTSGAFMGSYIISLFAGLTCAHFALYQFARPWSMSTLDLAWVLYAYGPAWTMIGRAEVTLAFLYRLLIIPPIALAVARVFLVRRAFVQPRHLLMKFFKYLDRTFFEANRKYTGGIVLVDDKVGLPDDEPIAWRETKKRTLGTIRYLFRVFIAIELPVLSLCLMAVVGSVDIGYNGLSVVVALTWTMVALLLAVQAGGLISSERSRETLAPLLATTLAGEDIIRQKYAGIRRAILVLRVPLLTAIGFQIFLYVGYRFWSRGLGGFHGPLYLVASLLAVWIFPHLVGWLGFLVSMRIKSQSRAVLTTVTVLVTWCLVPYLLRLITGWALFAYLSPVMQISLAENKFATLLEDIYGESRWYEVARSSEHAFERAAWCWAFVTVSYISYGIITLWLRRICLRSIPSLGRGEQIVPRRNSLPPNRNPANSTEPAYQLAESS